MNIKRFIYFFALLLMAVIVISGCAGVNTKDQLLVWTGMDEEDTLRKIASDFTAETGINVKIVRFPFTELQPKFQISAPVGQGPDLLIGPHDWIGTLATAKLIKSVDLPAEDIREFIPVTLKAMSFGGKLYGLPLSQEAICLIYNKKLVSTPPETMDELISKAVELNKGDTAGFLFDICTFYYVSPFIYGFGGYVFKDTPSGLDPNDIGLDNNGAIDAINYLNDIIYKYKLVPKGTNKDIANGKFIDGQCAFTINGPWTLVDFTKAKLDFGVAPIPKLSNGKYPQPFVGVLGIILNGKTKNEENAVKFMKHLCSKNGEVAIYSAGGRIPSRFDALKDPLVAKDKEITVFAQSANNGVPMPNIPEMTQVWPYMGAALSLAETKKQSPKEALTEAVKMIREGIINMKE